MTRTIAATTVMMEELNEPEEQCDEYNNSSGDDDSIARSTKSNFKLRSTNRSKNEGSLLIMLGIEVFSFSSFIVVDGFQFGIFSRFYKMEIFFGIRLSAR